MLPALAEDTNDSSLLREARLKALHDFLRKYGPSETEPITPCSFPDFSFQSPDGKLVFSSFALFLKYVDFAPTRIQELETALHKAGLKFDHLTPFVECDFYVPNLYEALKGKGDLKQKSEIYRALRTICEQEWGEVPPTGKMFHKSNFDWNREAMSAWQVRGKPGINGFIARVFSIFSLFEDLYGLRSRNKHGGFARARVCAELRRLAAQEARAAWQADKRSPARAKADSAEKKTIILPELDRAKSWQTYEVLGQALEHFLRDYGSAESAPITPLSFPNFRFESRSGALSFSSFGMFLHSISAHALRTPLSELAAALKKNGFESEHLEDFSRCSFYVPNLYQAMTMPENHPDARREIYRALRAIVEQKWGDSLPSPKALRLGLDWEHVTSLGDITGRSQGCLANANSVVSRFCTIYGLPNSRGRAHVVRMLQRLAKEEARSEGGVSRKLKELEQQRQDAAFGKTSVPAPAPAPPPTPKKQLETTLAASPLLLFRALTLLGWERNGARAYLAFKKRLKASDGFRTAPGKKEKPDRAVRPTTPAVALYANAVGEALSKGNKLDLSGIGLLAHTALLKELCLLRYDGNVKQLIKELEDAEKFLSDEFPHEVRVKVKAALAEICPKLQELFEAQEHFEPAKTVQTALFVHQRIAAVEALKDGKLINGHETGLGKALDAVVICEAPRPGLPRGFERVLWVTSAGNRADDASEIRKHLGLDENSRHVRIIPRAAASWDVLRIEEHLEGTKYAVVAYETLRSAWRRSKDIYSHLCCWSGEDGGAVINEAHKFDKLTSQRTQALLGIATHHRYLATASLYQSRSERLAVLLHLAKPRIYSDVKELMRLCRDAEFAKALIAGEVSLAFMDSVAEHLVPEEVMPFEQQLRLGKPRIPKTVIAPVEYVSMSAERSWGYLEVAVDHSILASTGQKSHPATEELRQLALLNRVLYQPQLMGLSPALELLAAFKKNAIPALCAGKKVLAFAKHRTLIDLFCSDPELKSFGLVCLDGRTEADERRILRERLESNPKLQIGIAQYEANATGSNIRVDEVHFLERTIFSTLYQSMGRAIRILGPGDEKFARVQVVYRHYVQRLADEVIATLPAALAKAVREEGTLDESGYANTEKALALFEYLRREGRELPESGEEANRLYLRSLAQAAERAELKSSLLRLLKHQEKQKIYSFNNPAKHAYHAREESFIRRHLPNLTPHKNHALLLSGHEFLEVPILERLGYARERMHCVEGGRAEVRQEFLRNVPLGVRPYLSRLEHFVSQWDQAFELFLFDRDGPIVRGDLRSISHIRLMPSAVVVINRLAGREHGEAEEMLGVVRSELGYADARQGLDRILLRLISTAHCHPLGHLEGSDAVRMYSAVRLAARCAAEPLSQALGGTTWSPQDLARALEELYLDSHVIRHLEETEYFSGRLRFLTTMAHLEARESEIRDSAMGTFLREAILDGVNLALDGNRSLIPSFYDFSVRGSKLCYQKADGVPRYADLSGLEPVIASHKEIDVLSA